MSGLVNKVKDAVTGHHHKDTTGAGLEHEHGSQSGVHDKSLSGSSVAHGDSISPTNKGVLHSTTPGIHGERDSGVTGTGITGQGSGLGGSHAGSAYDSTTGTTTGATGTTGTSGHGLHSSGLANKADPRVDSDRDGSRNLGATGSNLAGAGSAGPQYTGTTKRDQGLVGSGVDTTGSGHGLTGSDTRGTGLTGSNVGGTGSGLTGNRSEYDSGYGGSTGVSGAGPHSSGLANKADPRVDSDRDGSRNLGGTGAGTTGGYGSGNTGSGLTGHHSGHDTGLTSGTTGTGSGLTGSSTGTGSGLTGNRSGYDSGYGGSTGVSGAGPHSSGLANKADPRVDSDRDGSRGLGGTGTGTTGYGSGNTGSGLTGSGSGLTGGSTGTGLTGTGTGHHTGGSGLTGSSTTGQEGLVGKAERYVEGSERHHHGDGHPEDIVHPGPHHTQTAKALDPHLN